MRIQVIAGRFAVARLRTTERLNLNEDFLFFSKTDEEFSLVCREDSVPYDCLACDKGWRAFRIEGQLEFDTIGIIAKRTSILAEHNIGLFAISTFLTDYTLVKEENLKRALETLEKAGFEVPKEYL